MTLRRVTLSETLVHTSFKSGSPPDACTKPVDMALSLFCGSDGCLNVLVLCFCGGSVKVKKNASKLPRLRFQARLSQVQPPSHPPIPLSIFLSYILFLSFLFSDERE